MRLGPEPVPIADYACNTGEGVIWHPDESCVYWTDIPAGRLFRYDPATDRHSEVYRGRVIAGMTIQEDGALLLFLDKGSVAIWRGGNKLEMVVESLPGEERSRYNDILADPTGRVFCGTMPTPERLGRLYRLDCDGSTSVILENVGCSNGMGFTPDLKHLYHTDSASREITIMDYDQATGALSNRRLFVRTPDNGSVPDGMAVDAEGFVWSAKWGGHGIVRYNPSGEEERKVEFPVPKVSCLIFGGQDYTDIYATTAGGDKKQADGPLAGALFGFNLGIRGVPKFRSKVRR
jgi:D-xylonolactonase